MGVYFNSPNKKLYTISEFLSMNPEIINNEFTFLQDYHRYIEVQHWNKSKIEKSNITISYPLFIYIQILYFGSHSLVPTHLQYRRQKSIKIRQKCRFFENY